MPSSKEAIEWCKSARKILKIKQEKGYKDTVESKKLSKALKAVGANLKKLKSKDKDAYDLLKSEFLFISGSIAKTAHETGSDELAYSLTARLEHFNNKIQYARGKIKAGVLEESKKTQVDEDRKIFESMLTRMEQSLEELKGKATEDGHEFVGNVEDGIQKAKEKGESEQYQKGINDLAFAEQESRKQLAQYDLYLQYKRALEIAKQKEEDVDKTINEDSSLVDFALPIKRAINLARASAISGEYSSAIDTLEGINILKELSGFKDQKKDLKGLFKAQDKYLKARTKAQDRLHEMHQLFGASFDSLGVSDYIHVAEILLKEAAELVENTSEISKFTEATEKLEAIKTHLKAAKKSSEGAKKRIKADTKAISDYKSLHQLVEDAKERIAELGSGFEDELLEISKLLEEADGKLQVDGVITLGYPEAIKELNRYKSILEEVKNKKDELNNTDLPEEFTKAEERVEELFYGNSFLFTSSVYSAYSDEFDEISKNSKKNIILSSRDKTAIDNAISELNKFGEKFEEACKEHELLRTKVKELSQTFDNQLLRLNANGIQPEAYELLKHRGLKVQQEEMVERDWSRAEDQFVSIIKQLREIVTGATEEYDEYDLTWSQIEKVLKRARKFAIEIMSWPPLASTANSLREEIDSLRALLTESYDYEACVKAYYTRQIREKYDSLKAKVKKAKPPRGEDLEAFRQTLLEADDKVRLVGDELRQELLRLEVSLLGVKNKNATEYHKRRDQLLNTWKSYYSSPSGEVSDVQSQCETVCKGLQDIREAIIEFLNDYDKVEEMRLNMLEAEEPPEPEGFLELSAAVGDEISKLSTDEQTLKSLRDELATADESSIKALFNKVKLIAAKQKLEVLKNTKKNLEDLISNVRKPLDLMIGARVHRQFQPYMIELERESTDIMEMLVSSDPYLIEMAMEMTESLKERVKAIDPESRDKGATKYKRVKEKWAALNQKLTKKFAGPDNKMAKYLPVTHKRLDADLQAAIVKAMKSSPDDGLTLLKELEIEIDEALEAAARAGDEQARFKARFEKLEKAWGKLKKSISGKADDMALSIYFSDRLSEAKKMRKVEGQMPEAWKLLETLEKMAQEIASSDDPRGEFQKLDAVHLKNQEEVRERARQFKAALKMFNEETYVQAKELVKQQEDGDIDMLKGLKTMAKTASKAVKPYLILLDKPLVEGDEHKLVPDMNQANTDFESAWRILREAENAVKRLETSGTTNVNIKGGFEKIERHWQQQVALYDNTLRDVSNVIKDVTESLEGLSEDEKIDFDKDVQKAAQVVKDLAGRFRLDGFGKAFKTLMEEPEGDKSAKAKLQKRKLAAREEVLRVMRQYRTDLLKYPIFTKLSDKSNPFDRTKLIAAFGQLRVSLKRIELGTLVGTK